VRQSTGENHGPQGEIPDNISFDDLKTVGSQAVSIDYPDKQEIEPFGRQCPYCEEIFRGRRGVMIHLGLTEGRGTHPDNAKEDVDFDDLRVVRIDENENVIEEVDQSAVLPTTRRRREREREASIEEKVRGVIKEFRQEGKDEAADRLEMILMDT